MATFSPQEVVDQLNASGKSLELRVAVNDVVKHDDYTTFSKWSGHRGDGTKAPDGTVITEHTPTSDDMKAKYRSLDAILDSIGVNTPYMSSSDIAMSLCMDLVKNNIKFDAVTGKISFVADECDECDSPCDLSDCDCDWK
jgi:hypothetical protein